MSSSASERRSHVTVPVARVLAILCWLAIFYCAGMVVLACRGIV